MGNAPEEVEHPASHGVERFVRDREPGGRVQLVDGQAARDPEAARRHPLDQPLVLVVLVADLADQLLEQVLEGDEPGGAAVLVHHDGEVELLGLELAQQRVGALRARDEVRRVQVLPQVEGGRQAVEVGKQVLGVEHPDDLVDRVLEDRYPRVELLAQQREEPGGLGGDVQAEHVGTGHHHLAHEGVLQLEHAMDHLALAALHHALPRPHVHQGAQLLLGDLGPPGLVLGAGQAKGDRGEGAEPGPDRLQQDREPRHRPVHPRREAQRVLDGQRHGQDLAEDGEQEHHARDRDGEALGAEDLLRDGRGERGGADVHHRDADQEGDQQLVGPGQERGQRTRRPALLLGELLEPRPTQREVRGLGAREQGGHQEQHPEPEQLRDEAAVHAAIHGNARSRSAPPPARRRRPRTPRSRRSPRCAR